MAAAVLAIAVFAAAGTALALTLTKGNAPAEMPLARPGPGGASQPPRQATQSPAASSPQPSSPGPSGSVAAGGDGVAVAPGVDADPDEPQVKSLVSSYFTAINNHDYAAYVSLFDQQFQDVYSPQQFTAGYGSTADSGETLTGISATGSGGLAATVQFTSHQQPSQSPDGTSCTHWTITLYLEQQSAGYLIGNPPPGYHSAHQPCQ